MRDMPLAVAKDIYFRGWWNMLNLEQVVAIAGYRVAVEIFECSVNLPQQRAAEFLQRALNSFNLRGAYYPDVKVDGDIGPKTLAGLEAFMRTRKVLGEQVLLRALNAQQGVYYLERGEARPANEDYLFGWFANRVAIA
jgi:lysozyme family protein